MVEMQKKSKENESSCNTRTQHRQKNETNRRAQMIGAFIF